MIDTFHLINLSFWFDVRVSFNCHRQKKYLRIVRASLPIDTRKSKPEQCQTKNMQIELISNSMEQNVQREAFI